MITINELVDIVAWIAGKNIGKRYDLTKPQGVRGRNSDNSKLRQVLKWEPQITLEKGLEITYKWIQEQLAKRTAPRGNHVTSVRSSRKLNEGSWR
jgi:nucleoside-diphosphate-sugar epimerase